MSVLPSTFVAATAETRPLIVADPMFRASRPEMTPSSNETLAGAAGGGASNEGGRASGPATISRAMVPCGYSKRRSPIGAVAPALSTIEWALPGAPLRPRLVGGGMQAPADPPAGRGVGRV